MGQMRVQGKRTTITADGMVTVPGEGEHAEPVVLGKLSRDGGKWLAQKRDARGSSGRLRRSRGAGRRWRTWSARPSRREWVLALAVRSGVPGAGGATGAAVEGDRVQRRWRRDRGGHRASPPGRVRALSGVRGGEQRGPLMAAAPTTVRGYDAREVVSALQKCIRPR
jgi:hypothetical protein